MGREIQVTTWYDIHEIKKELDNISGASKKLDYLMKAKLEKKRESISHSLKIIGEQTTSELNNLIEYWRYKANDKGTLMRIKMLDEITNGKIKEKDKIIFLYDAISSTDVKLSELDKYKLIGSILDKDWTNVKTQINQNWPLKKK